MFEIIKIILLYLNFFACLCMFYGDGVIYFPFKKQLPDLSNLTTENIIYKGLQTNKIITEINLGTKPQTIPVVIDLHFYAFFISGEDEKKNEKNNIFFNQSKSTTYNKYDIFGQFGGRGFTLGYKSSDYFYLNNNFQNKYNLSFILAEDPNDELSGMIGLKLNEQEDQEILEYNFIKQLKNANAINDYYFTIKYINSTNGDLIIGDLPENYDTKYINREYKETYTAFPNSPTSWNIQFDSIYTKSQQNVGDSDITDLGKFVGYFRINLGITIGSEEYRMEFLKSFMNEQINKGNCLENFVNYYYIYYCNYTVNFTKMKKIGFYNKELNFSFEFTYKDLFYYNKLDNKYYFLIEFERNTEKNHRWLIGEFFFKKYQLIFNQDSKKIGIYTDKYIKNKIIKNKSWISKNKGYIIIIAILLVMVIVLGVLIYYIIKMNPKRKIKANELNDEDYDYTINNDEGNKQ